MCTQHTVVAYHLNQSPGPLNSQSASLLRNQTASPLCLRRELRSVPLLRCLCLETIAAWSKQQRRGFQKFGSPALPKRAVALLPSQRKNFSFSKKRLTSCYARRKHPATRANMDVSFASSACCTLVGEVVCVGLSGCRGDAGRARLNPRGLLYHPLFVRPAGLKWPWMITSGHHSRLCSAKFVLFAESSSRLLGSHAQQKGPCRAKGTSTGGFAPACDGFVHQYFAHTAYLTQTEYSPQ
jgi:hypothetical protein